MNQKEILYPESRFGGFTDIDGTITFYIRVNALLSSSFTVLDVGCGRGAGREDPIEIRRGLRVLKGKVQKVIGIDVDNAGSENPFLDEFRLMEKNSWPIDDSAVDLIVADFVLEHIEEPGQFFFEARRVLRPGGYLCIRTPNAWSYVAMIARLVPNRYHSHVTQAVQDDRNEADVFPTVYRCNSRRRIQAMMRKHSFDYVVYGYEAEPSYLAFSKVAYWLGVVHQRFAPAFLKPTIFAFGRSRKV